MFPANFVVKFFKLLGLMPKDVVTVAKNICRNTGAGMKLNFVENKATGVSEKDYLKDMVENVFAVEKKNLSFWRLTM